MTGCVTITIDAKGLRECRLIFFYDRYLANIQRNGTFSVVPRVSGGEITPDGLIVIGQVAKKCLD